jgi:hypothetical protein
MARYSTCGGDHLPEPTVGGVVAAKKFDPLWEIIDEKRALQGVEPVVDLTCPHCHVPLDLGAVAGKGQAIRCGLCGGSSNLVQTPKGPALEAC